MIITIRKLKPIAGVWGLPHSCNFSSPYLLFVNTSAHIRTIRGWSAEQCCVRITCILTVLLRQYPLLRGTLECLISYSSVVIRGGSYGSLVRRALPVSSSAPVFCQVSVIIGTLNLTNQSVLFFNFLTLDSDCDMTPWPYDNTKLSEHRGRKCCHRDPGRGAIYWEKMQPFKAT